MVAFQTSPAAIRFFAILAFCALLISSSSRAFFGNHYNVGNGTLIQAEGLRTMAFGITSASFTNGGEIPKKFTCDGADVSPELTWIHPPTGTQSFALIMDDPDAPPGSWTHWVIFDLPAQISGLPEAVPKVDELPTGGHQGRNDFRKIGYGGPCPPPGKAHRYFFKLYALDRMLSMKPGSCKQEVERAMENHILEKTEVVGKYQR